MATIRRPAAFSKGRVSPERSPAESEAARCPHDLVDDREWDDHGDVPGLVVVPDHEVRVIAFPG